MALTRVKAAGSTGILKNTSTLTSSNMPAGTVLQVQTAIHTNQESYNSTSWTAVDSLTVNLTCSSTSNKVLILVNLQGYKNNNTDGSAMYTGVYAGAHRILTNHGYYMRGAADTGSYGTVSNSFLYSPNSTSQITYKVYARSGNGDNYILNATNSGGTANSNDSTSSTLTVMEIAG
tara:strand:+ start:96 stop:623 length:528 start_codon:yes stop_codon:yes gene_type:complete